MSLHAEALRRVRALMASAPRAILGLVGPPGGGKSTLAQALLDTLPGQAVVVPMDGFHLANAELQRLGRAARKGAPDTFDAAGYVALLRRLKSPRAGETVYAPAFHREIEEAVAGSIAVPPEVPLVITEGNYLLLDDGPWRDVRAQLDACWYVNTDEALRLQRLVLRHEQFGRSPQAARDWVRDTDEPNARLIERTRDSADWQFHWDS